MSEYHKIQTVWLRDPSTNHKTLLEGQWAKPEFGWLSGNEWVWTEKVDGTNIRIIPGDPMPVRGKTDNATTHPHLIAHCLEIAAKAEAMLDPGLTLYGEGFGAGIQKGGGSYRPDKGFVLFDVCMSNGVWLERPNVYDIAVKLGIPAVPIVGVGPLTAAIEWVRYDRSKSAWGDFIPEGLVMRPAIELRNRFGERVITKLKRRDFGQ